jgi:peptidoglycan/LPS O-acetylase OafA/YrhL
MKYRSEIDGLRALAVLPVILFHAGFKIFSGGYVGVDIFFVISGYLISSIIIVEKAQNNFSLLGFYERRARRILPALFLVLLVCLPAAWLLMLPADLKNFSKSLVSVVTFSSNFLFWRWSGYFDSASELKPLLHTWSLSVEEQFYLFFPILLIFIWKFRIKWIFFILLICCLISFSLGQFFSISRPFFSFFMLPTRGWELLLGSLLAIYTHSSTKKELPQVLQQAFSILGFGLIIWSIFSFTNTTPYPSYYALAPTIGTALIIWCANQKNIIGQLLSHRFMVAIGLVSYSAYLWHQPILAFARHGWTELTQFDSALIVALTFMIAFFCWRFVEKPFRDKNRFNRKFIFKYTFIFSLIFIIVGVTGVINFGFSFRFPPEDRALAEMDVFEQGNYVSKRFIEFQGVGFRDDGRKKILLIGDSFAKDMTNVIYESDLKDRYQLSTHYIPGMCGNLAQKFNIEKYILPENNAMCLLNGWYEVVSLQHRLSEADEIWLASNWEMWVAQNLAESVALLTSKYSAKVLVFGIKDFGKISFKNILNIPTSERKTIAPQITPDKVRINEFMVKTLKDDNFVNLIDIFCTKNNQCPIFTPDLMLLSYDGIHLTRDGANYLGGKLSKKLP